LNNLNKEKIFQMEPEDEEGQKKKPITAKGMGIFC
jgi:hypothetical protein